MNKIKYLLVADGLSIFGGWIDFIVLLSIASFKFNINPFEISVLSALMLLPSIVLVNFIGKISNSHNSINYLLFFLLVRSIIGIILVLSNSLIIFSFFVILRSISNSFTLPLIQTVTAKNILHEHRGSYYSSLNMI
jgi:sugar phosphate permease